MFYIVDSKCFKVLHLFHVFFSCQACFTNKKYELLWLPLFYKYISIYGVKDVCSYQNAVWILTTFDTVSSHYIMQYVKQMNHACHSELYHCDTALGTE